MVNAKYNLMASDGKEIKLAKYVLQACVAMHGLAVLLKLFVCN